MVFITVKRDNDSVCERGVSLCLSEAHSGSPGIGTGSWGIQAGSSLQPEWNQVGNRSVSRNQVVRAFSTREPKR